jgi:hypothetical protein
MGPEIIIFALFYLGGHPEHPSPVLSLLGKRGTTGGSLKGVTYHLPPQYLTFSILEPSTMY